MFTDIRTFLIDLLGQSTAPLLVNVLLLIFIAIISTASYYLVKHLLSFVEKFVLRSPTNWDDDLFTPRLMRAVSQLAPALIVNWMLPGFFGEDASSMQWLRSLTSLYIVWAGIYIIVIFIDNLYEAMLRRPKLKAYAIKGIFQTVKLVFIAIGIIIGLSILVGRTPVAIITALGASAAVLMLVFKDTILGLVASVQLTANKMLERGDWIVVDKHGANGEVVDVSLTTVKVRNWDNSVTTIPPYALVSESFRNYNPMQMSGARRICRPIFIDANSVGFCDKQQLADLHAEGWLDGMDIDDAARIVNLGLLRRYLDSYIASHPAVRTDLIHMVRQLEPSPSGLPLELYFFISETRWRQYELLQSEIFDHVYAIVHRFGLTIYQHPSGTDMLSLSRSTGR